jgi:hypothetical protein
MLSQKGLSASISFAKDASALTLSQNKYSILLGRNRPVV